MKEKKKSPFPGSNILDQYLKLRPVEVYQDMLLRQSFPPLSTVIPEYHLLPTLPPPTPSENHSVCS